MCPICGYMVESGFHTLRQCLAAQDAWGHELSEISKKPNFLRPVFLQVVEGLFLKFITEEMALIMELSTKNMASVEMTYFMVEFLLTL
jgi:hypothetical protein